MDWISQCSIWGPTCEGLDQVIDLLKLARMKMGDWITFENMEPTQYLQLVHLTDSRFKKCLLSPTEELGNCISYYFFELFLLLFFRYLLYNYFLGTI